MITTTSKSEIQPCEVDEADIIIVRYEPGTRAQGKFIHFIRRPLKWFGFLSTVLLGTAALVPNIFTVPLYARPWVFLAFVFWLFAFCAGFFNL